MSLIVGCSGFSYSHWKNIFYPESLQQSKWLAYYSDIFNSVELNVTFYRLPHFNTFEKWYKTVPDNFIFSVKGPRLITHIKKLLNIEESLKLFYNTISYLKEKLGIVLWQFPPSFVIDIERFENFLILIKNYPVRNSFEFRHESWLVKDITNLIKKYNMAFCSADWPLFLNNVPIVTNYIYIRRHGKQGNYATNYSDKELRRDALRIKGYLRKGISVFIYFNNDYNGYAPKNAKCFIEIIKSL